MAPRPKSPDHKIVSCRLSNDNLPMGGIWLRRVSRNDRARDAMPGSTERKNMKIRYGLSGLLAGVVVLATAVSAVAAGGGGAGGGGPGGGGGGAGGGGGGTAPVLVNYKVTGTIQAPIGCQDGLGADICQTFATGIPFTLTYTVDIAAKAGVQKFPQNCIASTAVDTNPGTISTTRTVAVFSKAVSNIDLELDNGVSYLGPGQSADVSLENDTCLAGGVAASDTYRIDAKNVVGLNVFPSFDGNNAAAVSFSLILNDQAGPGLAPLPPTALTSLDLATAAPEAHLLQYNQVLASLSFRFPTVGVPSWTVGLTLATLEVVP
jgi:hypothetical protein